MRLEWGPVGGPVIAEGCDVAVVVDVLSFTTTLTVAADRGVAVIPCPTDDHHAEALARRHHAQLAVRRSEAGRGQVSLSPSTVRAAENLHRLVLPSPNGSTISAALAQHGVRVVGASLRNRRAVATWLHHRAVGELRPRVALIPSGERWTDGTLRPAVEDLWGAGAVASALLEAGWTGLSPEAHAAANTYRAVHADLEKVLHQCVSGHELDDLGHPDDVDIAAELDRSTAVPVLDDGVFTAAD
ncbi:2-phosphosulfolactate phosphatase [Actinomycetospora endophytica]|uniref:Probable 2-phosphosulfolactate phosphatase n=1 Tax=Actinomycetospora endophytica TaxID=2291215 RepID=A0ABS8PFL1_9PSEU|nr:2-phosphosulfolactate phosphatase [Actinomycetospora endophytica]MCD2197052.1 2-phosphosulfolactate phosphatase [Actinomycetospora endophytica]